MRKPIVILLSFALAVIAFNRLRRRKPALFQNLKGWQKLLGLVAIVLALIILLNPEFLALGLLGDSAMLDMLALALSVQMLMSVQWAWHRISQSFLKTMRWFGIPSAGFRFLIAISAVCFANAVVACQKIINRLSS